MLAFNEILTKPVDLNMQSMANLILIFGSISIAARCIVSLLLCFFIICLSTNEKPFGVNIPRFLFCILILGFITTIIFMFLGYQTKFQIENVCGDGNYDANYTNTCIFYNNRFNPVMYSLTALFSIISLGIFAVFCAGILIVDLAMR